MRTTLTAISWTFFGLLGLWLLLGTVMILSASMLVVGDTVMLVLFIAALLATPALLARAGARRLQRGGQGNASSAGQTRSA
jgi:hypothetical protein